MGAGKDFLVQAHAKRFSNVRVSFGDRVKEALSVIYDIPLEVFHCTERKWLQHPNLPKGMTIREAMQLFGTQVCRAMDPDVWLNAVARTTQKCFCEVDMTIDNVIFVTDVRFPNEVALIRRLGGINVYVENPEAEQHLNESLADGTVHESEKHCASFRVDPEFIKFRNIFGGESEDYQVEMVSMFKKLTEVHRKIQEAKCVPTCG